MLGPLVQDLSFCEKVGLDTDIDLEVVRCYVQHQSSPSDPARKKPLTSLDVVFVMNSYHAARQEKV